MNEIGLWFLQIGPRRGAIGGGAAGPGPGTGGGGAGAAVWPISISNVKFHQNKSSTSEIIK